MQKFFSLSPLRASLVSMCLSSFVVGCGLDDDNSSGSKKKRAHVEDLTDKNGTVSGDVSAALFGDWLDKDDFLLSIEDSGRLTVKVFYRRSGELKCSATVSVPVNISASTIEVLESKAVEAEYRDEEGRYNCEAGIPQGVVPYELIDDRSLRLANELLEKK